MFERYTEEARRTLFFSRYEASQLGQVSIQTEHILLGLVREGRGVLNQLLGRANVTPEAIRDAIVKRTVSGEKLSTSVEIPFSKETKNVLQFAALEADALNHKHIGTEHLLLGLLREEQSVAASVLTAHGVTLKDARQMAADRGNEPSPGVTDRAADQDSVQAQIRRIERMLRKTMREVKRLKDRLGH